MSFSAGQVNIYLISISHCILSRTVRAREMQSPLYSSWLVTVADWALYFPSKYQETALRTAGGFTTCTWYWDWGIIRDQWWWYYSGDDITEILYPTSDMSGDGQTWVSLPQLLLLLCGARRHHAQTKQPEEQVQLQHQPTSNSNCSKVRQQVLRNILIILIVD